MLKSIDISFFLIEKKLLDEKKIYLHSLIYEKQIKSRGSS